MGHSRQWHYRDKRHDYLSRRRLADKHKRLQDMIFTTSLLLDAEYIPATQTFKFKDGSHKPLREVIPDT